MTMDEKPQDTQVKGFQKHEERKIKPSNISTKVKGWIGTCFVESILLDSFPAFLCYDKETKKISITSSIVFDDTEYVPLKKGETGYEAYSFAKEELQQLLDTDLTRESMLDEIKKCVDMFVVAPDVIKYLTIGDVLFTYCQEWIRAMHFIFSVGDTESGKSSILHVFKEIGYRCLYGTNLPFANIYNFLGTDEEATGTIAEDEVELDKDRDKVRLYKNSYARGSLEPRVLMLAKSKKQIYYKTFCFKLFAAENLPKDKGLKERFAVCYMKMGKPKMNIKFLEEKDKVPLRLLRNKLLVWKVQNIEKGLDMIQSGLQQRDQELYEDYLRVMSGTKYEEEGKKTVDYFVRQRHEKIWNSLEARIFKLVLKYMEQGRVYSKNLFEVISSGIEFSGTLERGTFIDEDSGERITLNSLAKMLEEKFQGKRDITIEFKDGKQQRKTSYIFDEKTLSDLSRKYNVNLDSDLEK